MQKDKWTAVGGLPDFYVGRYMVPNFMSNAMLLKGPDGHWLVMSPGKSLLEDFKSIRSSDEGAVSGGMKLSIVMPNAYHFMGVESWLQAFPEAKLFASQKAIPLLAKKGVQNVNALESSEANLPAGYRWVFPKGHRAGDAWLLYEYEVEQQKQIAWVICDSFLNYKRMSKQPAAKFMQKLLGAAPGIKISQVVKYLILDGRPEFKAWVLEMLEASPPNILIPSHGEIDDGENLAERLKQVVQQRL